MKHRFWVSSEQIQVEEVNFTQEQSHQLRSVLRLRPGDQIRVFDDATRCDHVVELQDAARGRIVGESPRASEPGTRLVMYPALLQRDKFEPVLQKLTEIGVAAIGPVLTARGVVREAPDEQRFRRWRSIVREAAEQSGRGVLPRLLPAQRLPQALASAKGTLVMGYEGERRHQLHDALIGKPGEVAVFVGPEGGYAAEEVALAAAHGAVLVSLGPRILRAETASPVLAALVLYELGDLSSPHASDDRP